jgi:hypothetical protein
MADILSIIGTSLRQLASWLGIDVNTLVLVLFGLLILVFVILFVIMFLTIRMKVPRPREPMAEGEAKEPPSMEYIEKTLLEFPAGQVKLEANIDRLVFKLMETEPKVVEKIVEIPAEEKPPEIAQVNVEDAKDISAAVDLMCRKYTMESLTIMNEKYEVISSNSENSKEDADFALALNFAKHLAPKAGGEMRRIEVRGKPSVYLYKFTKDEKIVLLLFRGGDKDPKLLDMIPNDFELLGKFLQPA